MSDRPFCECPDDEPCTCAPFQPRPRIAAPPVVVPVEPEPDLDDAMNDLEYGAALRVAGNPGSTQRRHDARDRITDIVDALRSRLTAVEQERDTARKDAVIYRDSTRKCLQEIIALRGGRPL